MDLAVNIFERVITSPIYSTAPWLTVLGRSVHQLARLRAQSGDSDSERPTDDERVLRLLRVPSSAGSCDVSCMCNLFAQLGVHGASILFVRSDDGVGAGD